MATDKELLQRALDSAHQHFVKGFICMRAAQSALDEDEDNELSWQTHYRHRLIAAALDAEQAMKRTEELAKEAPRV